MDGLPVRIRRSRRVRRRAAVPRAPARHVVVDGSGELGDGPTGRHRERAGGPRRPRTDRRGPPAFEEAVRVAELQVARFTGLEQPTDVVRDQPGAPRRLGERQHAGPARAAGAGGREDRRRDGRGDPRGDRSRACPRRCGRWAACSSSSRRCSWARRSGTVLGFLGQRVLGQYDIAIPRSGPGSLLFVVSNIAAFEQDWSLDPTDFRTSVALHEVTHRFEFARPWARERFARAAA